jgi:hypothetical protein
VIALQEHPAHVLAPARVEQQVDDALRVAPAVDVVPDEADRVSGLELESLDQRLQLARAAVDVANREEAPVGHDVRSRTSAASAPSFSRMRSAAL